MDKKETIQIAMHLTFLQFQMKALLDTLSAQQLVQRQLVLQLQQQYLEQIHLHFLKKYPEYHEFVDKNMLRLEKILSDIGDVSL